MPLIDITDLVENLKALRTFASKEENVVRVEHMMRIANGNMPPIGDDVRYRMTDGFYRIVFSHDEQPQRNGTVLRMAHVSISTQSGEKVNLAIIDTILQTLGFRLGESKHTYFDPLNYGGGVAFNMIQPVEPEKPSDNKAPEPVPIH